MELMKRFKIVMVTAFISNAWVTYAQEKESIMDPVSVTASINPLIISKTGRNIVVIKGEQFSDLPVHSIDELLRYVPGIEVQQRGPMGSQSDIILRGGTFQQVLVLLDGIRINDPNTGHFTSYIPIASTEIDRIEVLKGAASSIYGSEAVGGVINIVTKSFSAKPNQPHHQVLGEAVVGEYNLINANIGANWQTNHSAFSAGLLSNNSDGQPQRGSRGFFHNHTASLSFHQFMSNNWNLSLRSSYDDRHFSAQNFYTGFVSDTAEEQVKTSWNQAKLLYQKASNRLSFDIAYKHSKDWYAYNTGLTPNQNTSRLLQSTVTFGHRFNPETDIIVGTQLQNKSIHSNDRGDHTINQLAGFVVLSQTFAGNFTVAPSVRIDYDEKAGTEFVPQVNLSYRKTDFQLRGSAGRTIRQADFTERFNNYNKTLVTSGSIGNPDLEAERSWSYEAGADYFLAFLKISSTIFRRDQKNVIDWVNTPYASMPRKNNLSPTGNYALATNIAKVKTTGFETDMQFTKNISKDQFAHITLGFTWLSTKTNQSTPSFYISSAAKYLVNLSANYHFNRLAIYATTIYKKRNPVLANAINVKLDEHCFMINTKLGYSIIKKKVECFIEADDLLNDHCRDLVNSLRPSRWFMAGIKLSLDK